MTTYEDALAALLDAAVPVGATERVATLSGLGRVLSAGLVSGVDVPPLDNSAMDGYAVSSRDVGDAETALPVSQRICAGATGAPLQPGSAARIFTGAPLPPGADTVVMQEICRREGEQVIVRGPVHPGENVRRAGEDIAAGAEVLAPGTRLRAQELGLAASIGCAELPVYRRLKVGLFFTGDELVEPGRELRPGQIYDSNRYTLHGLLQTSGCEIVDLGIVPDNLEATRRAVALAVSRADLVITSGGVSVGEEDHVRIALEQLGQLSLWRIAMKPGKPLAFGHVDGTPFIGLPGNPVSVFATYCLFVSPFIRRMQGMHAVLPTAQRLRAGFTWEKPGERREFLRARVVAADDGQTAVEIFPNQGSGVLTSTSWAEGLVVIPIGASVRPGDPVEYLPFTALL